MRTDSDSLEIVHVLAEDCKVAHRRLGGHATPVTAQRDAYDHRLRNLVCRTKDVDLAAQFGVPRSTARSWLRRGPQEVVRCDDFELDAEELRLQVVQLKCRTQVLLAIIRLLLVLVRMSGARLDGKCVPDGTEKTTVMRGIQRAARILPLRVALRIVGLKPARYHAWRRVDDPCKLDDLRSCPNARPTQLAPKEVRAMHQMVTGLDFRHLSVRALALHAQRGGRVFAAPGTWLRQIREHGWLRARRRLHPPKPKDGVRATRPNELWHLDVTIIRLLDGTRLYLHGVLDNYSRKLLAWQLTTKLEPTTTCRVLMAAGKHLAGEVPTFVADSGVENVNGEVDELLNTGQLRRVLAQVEVSYSNSMIEAWWRSLKHAWLYLHSLDSVAAVERLVAFYVEQHNTIMPHRAFDGRTPDEVYFGTAANLERELAQRRLQARLDRVAMNRALTCNTCVARDAPTEALPREAA